jgi:hypothetical protein
VHNNENLYKGHLDMGYVMLLNCLFFARSC